MIAAAIEEASGEGMFGVVNWIGFFGAGASLCAWRLLPNAERLVDRALTPTLSRERERGSKEVPSLEHLFTIAHPNPLPRAGAREEGRCVRSRSSPSACCRGICTPS